MRPTPRALSFCAAISVMFFWSGWLVLSRWGVTHALTNLDIMVLRFGTACCLTLPFVFVFYRISDLRHLFHPKTILVGLACGVPYVWLCFIGLEMSVAANAGVVINGSLPIFTLLIMWLISRKLPNKMQLFGILLIVCGNIIILANDQASHPLSYLLLLSAGCLFSIYASYAKFWQINAKKLILVAPTANFILILPIWLLSDTHIGTAPWEEIILQALYQGILVSIFVLWLMSFALAHISSYALSFIMAFVPIIGAFLAFLFLEEPLTEAILIGAGICTLGIMSMNIPSVLKYFKKAPFKSA